MNGNLAFQKTIRVTRISRMGARYIQPKVTFFNKKPLFIACQDFSNSEAIASSVCMSSRLFALTRASPEKTTRKASAKAVPILELVIGRSV